MYSALSLVVSFCVASDGMDIGVRDAELQGIGVGRCGSRWWGGFLTYW